MSSAVHHNCLNCQTPLKGKFCSSCGQKAATHRITTRHFIQHDLLHGALHIEKGLFYTILQAFKKRGKAAAEYIAGKRVNYYNVFYLSLILLGLNILVVAIDRKMYPENVVTTSGNLAGLYSYISTNIKFIVFAIIPLIAFNTYVLFRRKKHNYAEHLVAAGFYLVVCLVLIFISNLFGIIGEATGWFFILEVLDGVLGVVTLLSAGLFYYPYVRPEYKFWGYLWRILVFYTILIIEFLVMIVLLNYALTGTLEINGSLML